MKTLVNFISEQVSLKNLTGSQAQSISKSVASQITFEMFQNLLQDQPVQVTYQGSIFDISHKSWSGNHTFTTVMDTDNNLKTQFTIESKYWSTSDEDNFKSFQRNIETDLTNIFKPAWLDYLV